MDTTFQLVIFDQTRSPQCCLGAWWSWQGDMAQLRSAANQLLSGPNPGSLRIFSASGGPGAALPLHHDLHWNDTLEDEQELKPEQAAQRLHGGKAIQLFVYNGDSDCIRHLLALPLERPSPWFPSDTR